MIFSNSRLNWRNSTLSDAEKREHFNTVRQILALVTAREFVQAKQTCQQMHNKVQCSCILHPISHLLLAHIALKSNDPNAFITECWVGFWAPLASFSRKIGANPRRRFFGVGPIRSSGQNRP